MRIGEHAMITYNKAIAAVITVTLINGFFSTNMMKKYKEMYSDQVEHLETKNEKLMNRLEEFNEFGRFAHSYSFKNVQTSTPFIMHIPGEKQTQFNITSHADIMPTIMDFQFQQE